MKKISFYLPCFEGRFPLLLPTSYLVSAGPPPNASGKDNIISVSKVRNSFGLIDTSLKVSGIHNPVHYIVKNFRAENTALTHNVKYDLPEYRPVNRTKNSVKSMKYDETIECQYQKRCLLFI